jgi:mono/diheme cytochrome c family protein
MITRHLLSLALSALVCLVHPVAAADPARDAGVSDADRLERGRYLVKISGCNDCHTPGYLENAGKVAETGWLTGSSVGFQGPWGTTYPSNLRRVVQDLTEAEWLERVRQPMRPPMPWFNLSAMTDDDLIALYRYIHHLGTAGEPVPEAAAPGVAVSTPYFDFVPKNLPAVAKR